MSKRDILIISPFADLPSEAANCRYFYLANLLMQEDDVSVELALSSFSHLKKAPRNTAWQPEAGFRVTYIDEPGYPKNVSLQRFRSHHIMGQNLRNYLDKRAVPDVVFCAVPSLDAAKAAAEYCQKHHVRFIIDVQDLWPEAFQMVFHVPVISDILFAPFRKQADYIYSRADDIVAVSQTYVDRAARVNTKGGQREAVYLGTKLQDFDKNRCQEPHDDGLIHLGYVGTLGHSYNITCILEALALLRKQGHTNIVFDIMGNGPLMEEFQHKARELDVPATFYGRLPYHEMVYRLTRCDVAVNPITKGAAQSIINKVGDYAAAGLPVISTQECPEYRNLVQERKLGFNCDNDDVADIAQKILTLANDAALRAEMGANNRRLAEERFDRMTSYQVLLKMLLE